MILDGHIHIMERGAQSPADFRRNIRAAGVDGGIVISEPSGGRPGSARRRIGKLLEFVRGGRHLYPFFWIEPMEKDALAQVDAAIRMGVRGFKVICQKYPPYDPKAMKVFRKIAARGKPLMFHSGILWDGGPSSIYNRPANWECMLDIKGIRFSLAHISWPWVDENVAVFGKIESARGWRRKADCEMFIDTTRGTPDIYRHDALFKVFKIGYDVSRNVFFGTDNLANAYDSRRAAKMVSDDRRILAKLRVPAPITRNYFSENLKKFVGV